MKKEYRYTWIDHIPPQILLEADILSFGSESCIIPFLHITKCWSQILYLLEKSKRLKIVTPRVSQCEISESINVLDKIFNLGTTIDVVINDWGLFEYCKKRNNVFKIHIGRQLSRSLVDCPWHYEITTNEKNSRDIISEHPYNDMEWIKFLKKKGVVGVELNSLEKGMRLQALVKHNMEVTIHEKNYLLTCGRTCLAKKIKPTIPCYELCDTQFDLELMGKWYNVFENQVEAIDYEKKLLKGLSICGKKVILPQKMSEAEMRSCEINVIIVSKKNNYS